MTIEETRNLGIEFERRVNSMLPNTEFIDKLDTDTIYSFINQYQDEYVRTVCDLSNRRQEGDKFSTIQEVVLQSLYKNYETSPVGESSGRLIFPLPSDFYIYVDSFSAVTSTYKNERLANPEMLHNILVSRTDMSKIHQSAFDKLRIIRQPLAYLGEYDNGYPMIECLYDMYTTVDSIVIQYYKKPQQIDIIRGIPCELPSAAFDEIVNGSVLLYIQYITDNRPTNRKRQPMSPSSDTDREADQNKINNA